jgi:signal transduction histidine kinase
VPAELDLPANYVETLLRIVREAINNAGRHAKASKVTVSLHVTDAIVLVVSDDGVGFGATDGLPGFGLTSMRERAEALGGSFMLLAPQFGTTIEVVIPWQSPS